MKTIKKQNIIKLGLKIATTTNNQIIYFIFFVCINYSCCFVFIFSYCIRKTRKITTRLDLKLWLILTPRKPTNIPTTTQNLTEKKTTNYTHTRYHKRNVSFVLYNKNCYVLRKHELKSWFFSLISLILSIFFINFFKFLKDFIYLNFIFNNFHKFVNNFP